MEELAICLHTFSANVASKGNITAFSQVLLKIRTQQKKYLQKYWLPKSDQMLQQTQLKSLSQQCFASFIILF